MLLEGIETLYTHGILMVDSFDEFGPLGWEINVVRMSILIHHALKHP